MKIAFVCRCSQPIPPKAYGAIELVVANHQQVLVSRGHQVRIVNINDGLRIFRRGRIIRAVNSFNPDMVHIVASRYFSVERHFHCRRIFLTDHAAEVSLPEYRKRRRALQKGAHTVCLSQRIAEHYLSAGAHPDYVHVIPNGIATDKYRFTENPQHKNRSIYLAVIHKRKRQHLCFGVPGIDFVGPVSRKAVAPSENYFGEWSRERVQNELTEYANLVLLSQSEAACALVCMEALVAGLGLVISQANADNLDTSLPFIDVIPEHKIHDRDFVTKTIMENRTRALAMRKQIREYAIKNFDIEGIIDKNYIPLILSIDQPQPA